MSFGQLFGCPFMLSADSGNFFQMGMEIARNK